MEKSTIDEGPTLYYQRYEKSCKNKVRHETSEEAEQVKRDKYPELGVYYCNHCQGWHLGHRIGHKSKIGKKRAKRAKKSKKPNIQRHEKKVEKTYTETEFQWLLKQTHGNLQSKLDEEKKNSSHLQTRIAEEREKAKKAREDLQFFKQSCEYRRYITVQRRFKKFRRFYRKYRKLNKFVMKIRRLRYRVFGNRQ